ncbi:DUF4262 domain-containing protein [Qaidamihabitans albus]|uniref:DUF4262 domain-containing protein n=1 Tax=Qaidamihabitans albus TaxID=2795733 RepID=UPI0018F15115|nr:DUF4262 domain-containing protein [Qaidamihabitans albus]
MTALRTTTGHLLRGLRGRTGPPHTFGRRRHATPAARPSERPDDWLCDTIDAFGWAIQYVVGDEGAPPFAYTIGLSEYRHPELILFGTDQYTAGGVLNALGKRVRHRRPPGTGAPLTLDGWPHRVHLVRVPDSSGFLLGANFRYRAPGGPPVPALQVVHDDLWGRFPWESGYGMDRARQPVLGAPPAS